MSANNPPRPQLSLHEALEPRFRREGVDPELSQTPVDAVSVEGNSDGQRSSKGKESDRGDDELTTTGSTKGKEPDRGDDDLTTTGSTKGKEPDRGDNDLTVTRIENGENSGEPSSGFLKLPYDIRHQIYQHLLRSNNPIATFPDLNGRPEPLHPQILRTCHQINSEGRDVLFGENIFELRARDLHCEHESELKCKPYRAGRQNAWSRKLQFVQRVELRIYRGPQFESIAHVIESSAQHLANMPNLKQLFVKVAPQLWWDRPDIDLRNRLGPIHALGMIRNLRKVTIEGVLPAYAERLIKKMISVSPLPKMYYDLAFFAGNIECGHSALRHAFRAALDDDPKTFLSARAKVIRTVKNHMRHAEFHLFDHDPKPRSEKKRLRKVVRNNRLFLNRRHLKKLQTRRSRLQPK